MWLVTLPNCAAVGSVSNCWFRHHFMKFFPYSVEYACKVWISMTCDKFPEVISVQCQQNSVQVDAWWADSEECRTQWRLRIQFSLHKSFLFARQKKVRAFFLLSLICDNVCWFLSGRESCSISHFRVRRICGKENLRSPL